MLGEDAIGLADGRRCFAWRMTENALVFHTKNSYFVNPSIIDQIQSTNSILSCIASPVIKLESLREQGLGTSDPQLTFSICRSSPHHRRRRRQPRSCLICRGERPPQLAHRGQNFPDFPYTLIHAERLIHSFTTSLQNSIIREDSHMICRPSSCLLVVLLFAYYITLTIICQENPIVLLPSPAFSPDTRTMQVRAFRTLQ